MYMVYTYLLSTHSENFEDHWGGSWISAGTDEEEEEEGELRCKIDRKFSTAVTAAESFSTTSDVFCFLEAGGEGGGTDEDIILSSK